MMDGASSRGAGGWDTGRWIHIGQNLAGDGGKRGRVCADADVFEGGGGDKLSR